MVLIRVIVLLFLVAYGFGMGTTPEYQLNGFGKFISMTFFFTAPALYFLPTYEAWKNQHPNVNAIALVNIFLGWSILGWVVAIVWAHKQPEPTVVISKSPATPTPAAQPTLRPVRETKNCKFCAEEILAAAIKCKHCGSDVAA
jgi:hypothetical protein